MTKTVAIVQSSYIPWKGYFDLINMVDEFILYEDVQFTKRDWRSRNAIKTTSGVHWLTVPCRSKGKFDQLICDTEVAEAGWAEKHLRSITHAYARAPYFREYGPILKEAYLRVSGLTQLSDVNRTLIEAICAMLEIRTRITDARSYRGEGVKSERLVSVCRAAGATRYISGPAARAYLDEKLFEENGIEVTWMDYSGYAEYPQLAPPFVHQVSVIDLVFHTGPSAQRYMKSFS